MIRSHLALEKLAVELNAMLDGSRLVAAWTQAKGVAYLVFIKDHEEIVLECDVHSQHGAIVRKDTARRAQRNTINIAQTAIDQTVALVTKHPDDRILTIWLESVQIHIELFSGGSGNIVLACDGVIVDALHSKQARIGHLFEVHRKLSQPAETREQRSAYTFIAAVSPNLVGPLAVECCDRLGMDPLAPYESLDEADQHSLEHMAQDVLAEAEASSSWYVMSVDSSILMAPIVLRRGTVMHEFTSTMQAIAKTVALREQSSQFIRQKQLTLKAIDKRISRIERTLEHVRADEAIDTREREYKLTADMLMAQPDLHQRDCESITIERWDTGELQHIKLNPELSLLQNAQRYYEKSRSAQKSAHQRSLRIPALLREQQELLLLRDTVASALTMKALPDLPMSIQRMNQATSTKTPDEKYRVFILDDQHTLYVGKSAANNDELTMKFARQQDWWLHVRGASGSHAVLRGVSGPKIPKQILEMAAAITAYYSQARNASYVPVVYTQRKFVRKPKGANIGAVVIEREQTVMIKPALPQGSDSTD